MSYAITSTHPSSGGGLVAATAESATAALGIARGCGEEGSRGIAIMTPEGARYVEIDRFERYGCR
jgi:hypothetical protein